MLSRGVLLGNRYRLDDRIAGGGMGDVWKGTDEVLGRTVAVKVLLPALLDEPGFAERFRGEARTMATINHPGVVDVYDYGSDNQVAFLVMEYVEGDALSRTLGRVGRLTPARTMALVAQAADALQAAHDKGIVHRDVKPGNLLVRPNGTLVLTDFGIARSALVGQLTAAGSVLGTASYISPEQATGSVATPASDVYALGVVAYQCLSGRRPFDGNNPLEIAMKHVRETPRPLPPDIPPQIRSIVERAMAKDPAARWPSATVLGAVARQAATAPAAPPRPPAQPPRPPAQPAYQGQPPRPPAGPGGTRMMPPYPPAGSPAVPAQRQPSGPPTAPGNRGAAPVPPARPRPDQGYGGYPRPSVGPSRPARPGTNRLLIVLLVVLGVVVLLCSARLSYQAFQQGNGSACTMVSEQMVTGRSQSDGGCDDSQKSPYRLEVGRLVQAGGV
ncbi:serine/threonine-protein kinase [Solwaraspora sp. WMMD1047]|uniref:serine/threonine-protein kinase n=1 Tax=Solwaraspora sp. WMMD1047 TaxID=3016102 RepID=UPI0024160152|nr:serine/threonine-protein kinase [Solwaraspora sp. WMMD1047]MDG4834635.1 serine/threonine-protein kinase [Solwaraspora sp. WMMD1047]